MESKSIRFFSDRVYLVLASSSPRRRQLIKELGFPYRFVQIDVEEIYPEKLDVHKVPKYLASLKAKAYDQIQGSEVLLTADTVVIQNNEILGKPKSREEAREMLYYLSGTTHEVITGVCLKSVYTEVTFSASTKVKFIRLTENEIDYYLQHYQVMDKAGSYAIQEWIGQIGVESIEGDFYNVMGLPVSLIFQHLKEF